MSRRFGWTSDNVVSMTLVTADGRIVRASEDENADLFWGLRGGGGNFGVVVDIEYKLYDVGPEIVGGAIAWPADQMDDVLALFKKTVADAPRELALVAVLRKAPPAPWLSPEVHGKPIVLIVACYTGPIEEGEKLLAEIRSFGTPAGDVIQRRPYVTQQALLDATQPNGRRYYWKSEYLPGVKSDMLEVCKEWAAKIESPHSAILLFPLGGALHELPEDHSAVGNRAAGFVFNSAASWEDPGEDAAHVGWAREAWQALKPFSTGGTYLNFLTEEEGDARVRDALGANYDRLIDIKTKWDPDNLFRTNKNIAPRQ
jgi:FAD/FMN-containing dehydrogenase